MIQLTQKVESAHIEADETQMAKLNLAHKVNMMYKKSLDGDLLDEQARKILGYAQKDELVYLDYQN